MTWIQPVNSSDPLWTFFKSPFTFSLKFESILTSFIFLHFVLWLRPFWCPAEVFPSAVFCCTQAAVWLSHSIVICQSTLTSNRNCLFLRHREHTAVTDYFNKDAAEGDYTGTNWVFHTAIFLIMPICSHNSKLLSWFQSALGGSIAVVKGFVQG